MSALADGEFVPRSVMARMRPEELPNTVRRDPLRSAEVRMYDAFATQLPDPWTVWYSVSWLGPRVPGERPDDGEADFILAHPDLGVLVIEVKGGTINYDSRLRTWISKDRNGVLAPRIRSEH